MKDLIQEISLDRINKDQINNSNNNLIRMYLIHRIRILIILEGIKINKINNINNRLINNILIRANNKVNNILNRTSINLLRIKK